jgi:hypothetical protein
MLEALARIAPLQPNETMARIAPRSPMARMVENKISLDKILWTKFVNFLEGSN